MPKFRAGHLHSGSKTGPKVTNPAQAAAIMYSEQKAEAANGGEYPEKDSAPVKGLKAAKK